MSQSPTREVPADLAEPDLLLHPSYKKLSDKPRSPAARLVGKRRDPTDPEYPGPGEYDPSPRADNRGPRMVSSKTLRLKDADVLDVPYYTPRIPPGRGAKIMDSRSEGSRAKRIHYPGPGAYAMPDTWKARKTSNQCTFGAHHKKLGTFSVPGPGAYETIDGPQGGGGRSARSIYSSTGGNATRSVTARQPTEPRLGSSARSGIPGPGAYDLGSTFGPKYGQCLPSIKGRLAHPMDDRNAAHECARTSSPRNTARKMRAAPRGF